MQFLLPELFVNMSRRDSVCMEWSMPSWTDKLSSFQVLFLFLFFSCSMAPSLAALPRFQTAQRSTSTRHQTVAPNQIANSSKARGPDSGVDALGAM